MKKHFLFVALIAALSTGNLFAAGTLHVKELGDSINAFAQKESKATLTPIKVQNIRQNGINIFVETNSGLCDAAFTPAQVAALKKKVSLWVRGDEKGKVKINTNGMELSTLIPSMYQPRPYADRHHLKAVTPLTQNASRPYAAPKGLDGKHIALWGSHGLYYVQDYQMWKWQRARLWTTVEDLYTSSYTRNFLVPMLENAGCVVLQPRERDIQHEEIIVDDNEAAAAGWEQTGKGFAKPSRPLYEGENPFTMGKYSRVACDENGNKPLKYIPSFDKEGDYAVYVSYASEKNSTDTAVYTVCHKGIETRYRVNQQMGGGTWIYLGTFRFGTKAGENYIRLSNEGAKGKVVTADAVKIGGGMGSVARYPQPGFVPGVAEAIKDIHGKNMIDSSAIKEYQKLASTSGYPRYIEGARYWLQYAGIPDSVYNFTESRNDYIDDYSCRGRWVNYLCGGSQANPGQPGLNIPVNMSMAFHSDAFGFPDLRQIGTLVAYTDWDCDGRNTFPAGGSRQCNRDLANYMMHEIVGNIRETMCPDWAQRRVWRTSLSETRNPVVPSALLELLSHQNYGDMIYGLNPEYKFIVSRAIYKAFLKFLHEQDGTPYIVQPLPVKNLRMDLQGAQGKEIRLMWEDRVDSLEPTAKADYWVVYTRKDNGDWDNGLQVSINPCYIPMERGVKYDFKVCAGNDGGLSMPSEVMSVYLQKREKNTDPAIFAGKKMALVINAFDRVAAPKMAAIDSLTGGILPYCHAIPYGTEISYIGEQFDYDRTKDWSSDDDCGFGMCFANKSKEVNIGNTFDYPVMHGEVLKNNGYSYISISGSAVDSISSKYAFVDLILGKNQGIPANLRKALTDYLNKGGKVLLSGSYIASTMQDPADTAFTKQVLHYRYKTQMASNCGQFNMLYNILPNRAYHWEMEPNERIIECEAPDGIEPEYGAKRIARYDDNGVCAGIAYDAAWNGKKNGEKLIVLPFMMESVKEFDTLLVDCAKWLTK